MTSLRRQLLAGTAAATAAVFALSAVTVYAASRRALLSEFDAGLAARSNLVLGMVEVAGDRVGVDGGDLQRTPEFLGGTDPAFYVIRTTDGRVARSPSLRPFPDAFPAPETESAGPIGLPDGRRGRLIRTNHRLQLDPDERSPGAPPTLDMTIAVAAATQNVDATLRRLALLLAGTSAGGTLLLLLAAAWVIRRGLAPMNRLAGTIGGIGVADLGERLDGSALPVELAPIAQRLNEMLARLQASFEREQCFTADAAHELRSPLAALQVALEVCASQPRGPAEYGAVVQKCLETVRRMHTMVENLLLLARGKAGALPPPVATTDLCGLVREAWSAHAAAAAARRLIATFDLPGPLSTSVDPDRLAIILHNLLDNAVRHADGGGTARVSAETAGTGIILTIANTGSRVRAEDADRVFDRFWRGDASRGSDGRHCGLGLSVCRRLGELIGVTLAARTSLGGEFQITMILPRGAVAPVAESGSAVVSPVAHPRQHLPGAPSRAVHSPEST